MAVEMFVKVPGLFKAEGVAVVFHGQGGVNAIAVSKSIVITSDSVDEWITDDVEYVVSNKEVGEVDEVIDLTDAAITHESPIVEALQAAAQMALMASEPGPIAAKFLEHVVEDADYAAKRAGIIAKPAKKSDKLGITGKTIIAGSKRAAARKTKAPAAATANEQVWYKAKDGKGFTQDPAQARMYAGHPVLAKGSAAVAS
jgi:hypothetical protein